MAEHLKASDWVVHGVDASEARRLIREQHYGGDAPMKNAQYRHGLFREGEWFGAECMGAAVWINALHLSRRFPHGGAGPLMLSRLVVDPAVPTNGASFLLGRSMRLIDRERWPVLVTYADTGQGHSGAIYKATNWELDGVGGAVCYYRETDGKQISSLDARGHFRPCPAGYEPRKTEKLRFVHRTAA